MGLSGVAEQAEEELGVGVEVEKLIGHSVRVNVAGSWSVVLGSVLGVEDFRFFLGG